MHLLPLGTGLVGDQAHAQYLSRQAAHIVRPAGQLDASALAPAAGMYLGLDDHFAPNFFGRRHRLINGEGRIAFGHRDAEVGENSLALVFVNLHLYVPQL